LGKLAGKQVGNFNQSQQEGQFTLTALVPANFFASLRSMRKCVYLLLTCVGLSLSAAELKINFSDYHEGEAPRGFRNAVTGEGKPGEWKVVLDETASAFQSLTEAKPTARHAVLAQLSRDATDEHFPLFIFENELFADFTLTVRIKTVEGKVEQMAGVAFRIQNETNYYVVRASSLGNTFKFYKILNGQRGIPVGPEIPIPSGVWHDLAVEAQGDQIRCSLDGKELISLRDKANPLLNGKIGFWTKSDSVSYFADPKIIYKPHVPPAQALVEEVLKTYPRLMDVKLYVLEENKKDLRLLASREKENGPAADKSAEDVIRKGTTYYGKDKTAVSVIMPLRDRNGDPMAAVRVVMKSFPGQTDQNALARAQPIVKGLQSRVLSLQDLVD
jgi:hypothetical protein